jgi:hypothetical protein
MKTILKDYIVPISTVLGIAVDLLLRFYSPSGLNFLIQPLFSINALEIILIVLVAYSIYRFFPSIYKKSARRNRANRLLNNWQKFKHILVQYNRGKQDHNLQQEYDILRDEVEKDFNYFLNDIIRIQRASHRNYNELVLQNLEKCWLPRNLSDWQREVAREIPKEVDCFDYVFVGLAEEMEK